MLDANANNATGDFATVLGALATATVPQGQAAMTALSGNNYAGFSTSMVQGAQLFMNNFANQTGGGGIADVQPRRLAEACDVACDSTTPPKWGAWGGALGGLGTIGANQPVGTVTYNVGGFAAGLDRLVTDNFRMGIDHRLLDRHPVGRRLRWPRSLQHLPGRPLWRLRPGQGLCRRVLPATPTPGTRCGGTSPFPACSRARPWARPAPTRWYGQIETGYRFDLGTNANAFVTPFARLQAYTGTQNAFTETGAQSLNLSVAQQTTNCCAR